MRPRLALVLLLAVAFLCCLPAVRAPFVYDEHAGIEENRVVHPGARLGEALAFRYSPDQVRPLFFASLLLDADLWGLRPAGMRLTGFLLHLLCGLLVWLLVSRTTSIPGAALAGTAIFLLHPLQSESVLYIWGRSEILSTLFGLLAVLLALRDGDRPPRPWIAWFAAPACVALALASKEEAVVVPALFLLWWTLVEGRPARAGLARASALAVPVLLFVAIRGLSLGNVGRQVYVRSVVDNILGQGLVWLKTLRLILLPIGQTIDHPDQVPSAPAGLLGVVVCLILASCAAWAARAGRRPGGVSSRAGRVACGVLIGALSAILYWAVPLPDLMCERRLYLPLVGGALAVSALAETLRDRARAVLVVALTVLLGFGMVQRARVWRDPVRLWSEAARQSPGKARPLINLGVLAAERRDLARARGLFGRAIALEPRNYEALFNRGKLSLDALDYPDAIADFEAAIAANPGLVRARINLGIARIDIGDLSGAETDLRAALEIEPRNPRALTNLAEVLRATRRPQEAVGLYREALDADPTYAHAAARLGVTLENLGDGPGALSAYREFLARGTSSDADRESVLGKIRALEQTAAPKSPTR